MRSKVVVVALLSRSARSRRHGDRAPWPDQSGIARLIWILLAAASFSLTSCQSAGLRHQFVSPALNWQAKIGQLQYRGPKTTLIGEVLVRFSRNGDFELTFTKGPGVTLIIVRQDANFVRVEGPLARGRWAGPVKKAPPRLRGWLALRNALMQAQKPTLKSSTGAETFLFEF
jgi:hypothetical protein